MHSIYCLCMDCVVDELMANDDELTLEQAHDQAIALIAEGQDQAYDREMDSRIEGEQERDLDRAYRDGLIRGKE